MYHYNSIMLINHTKPWYRSKGRARKIGLIMKLTTIFLLIGLLQVNASSLAQQVSLNVKNTSLKNVFDEINKQTGYNFSWSSSTVNETVRVDVNVKNVPLTNVLDQLLHGLPLTYTIKGKNILVKEKARINKVTNRVPQDRNERQNREISGTVSDKNGEALPGVNI